MDILLVGLFKGSFKAFKSTEFTFWRVLKSRGLLFINTFSRMSCSVGVCGCSKATSVVGSVAAHITVCG
jgi:hypothetical protein